MTERDPDRPRGGRASKCRAILTGGLTVFARSGYTRASIDAIAAQAQVSTRTIYNHFEDKAALFGAVLSRSTTRVAEAQVAIIERHLGEPHTVSFPELESRLVALGTDLAAPMPAYAEHFALIRMIDAEPSQVPPSALDAWRENGPRRVTAELARHLQRLGEQVPLRITDPTLAASQFMLLVRGAIPFQHGVGAPDEAEKAAAVTSGVRVFLYGYVAAL